MAKIRLETKTIMKLGTTALAAVLAAACSGKGEAVSTSGQASTSPTFLSRDVCPKVSDHLAQCQAKIRINVHGDVVADAAPSGFGAPDIQSAYKIPSGGAGMTIALVDAFDNPNAESDLGVYRAQYGLPPCTTANGCFKKVNQLGQTSPLPETDPGYGWVTEIMLDIEMASAVCPSCNIILVEADDQTVDDLGTGVNSAVTLGANAISNSYGFPEDPSYSADEAYFNHPGVFITASSGDYGFGVYYPAESAYVTSVGGTSLTQDTTTTRGWSETAWNAAGSGCSSWVAKPSFQTDTGCANRMVADISAVADPNTGVAVYDTTSGGWTVVGGTSVSSPLVASIFAVTGHTTETNAYSYSHTSNFYDVTSGSNGTCSPAYECTAGAGYDGPTGNGTPNAAAIAGSPAPDAGAPDSGAPDAGPSGNLVTNGDFQSGDLSGWTITKGHVSFAAGISEDGSAGSALLGRTTPYSGYSVLQQSVSIPATGKTTLSYWGEYSCAGDTTSEYERVWVLNSAGKKLLQVAKACDAAGTWEQTTVDLTKYAGQIVTLQFADHDDKTAATYWYLSGVSVTNE
jgi:subtilase family serine protease